MRKIIEFWHVDIGAGFSEFITQRMRGRRTLFICPKLSAISLERFWETEGISKPDVTFMTHYAVRNLNDANIHAVGQVIATDVGIQTTAYKQYPIRQSKMLNRLAKIMRESDRPLIWRPKPGQISKKHVDTLVEMFERDVVQVQYAWSFLAKTKGLGEPVSDTEKYEPKPPPVPVMDENLVRKEMKRAIAALDEWTRTGDYLHRDKLGERLDKQSARVGAISDLVADTRRHLDAIDKTLAVAQEGAATHLELLQSLDARLSRIEEVI